MSSISPRWRSSSRASRSAMSGSTCSRPAERRSSSSSGATAIGRMLLRAHDLDAGERVLGGDRALAQHAGSGPVRSSTVDGVPEARRRRARRRREELLRHVLETSRIGSTVEVRARRRHCSHLVEQHAPEPASRGRGRRSSRPLAREPRVPASRVREDERVRPGQQRPRDHAAPAPQLGTHPSRTSTLAARGRSAARATVSWPPTAPAPGPSRYGEQARPYTVSVGITTSPWPGRGDGVRDEVTA